MNTHLTDRRIDTMRSTILDAVDADIDRRGKRTRTRLGLVAAGAIVIAGGSIGYQSLTSTSGDVSISASDAGVSEIAPIPRDALLVEGEESLDSPENSAGSTTDAVGIEEDQDRDVITSGYIEVTVADPRESAQRLSTWVTSIGGRIDARNESGDDASGVYASLTIRVPSEKVADTIERLRQDGTVDSVSIDNTDVTAQTRDLDARIKALKISIGRLEALLEQASTTNAIINAENALTERQQQLESLTAQRRLTADQVSLSTLGVSLKPSAKAESVEAGGFKGGLIDGWNSLVSTVNTIVEGLGAAIPWLALTALLYGLWRLITRLRRS